MKIAYIIRQSKPVSSVLLAILIVSMIIPFANFGTASAAEPTPLTQKWVGYVGGGGEALLTADVLSAYPGEEVFHAGGSVAPNSGGRISCLNGITGAAIWTRSIANVGDTCQIQMVDMDNDGDLEIVVPLQQPSGIYILHAEDGSTMFSVPNLGGGRIDSSPVAGDVDGDGFPDLYVGVMGYEEQPTTGKLIHYEWNQASSAVVERGRVTVWHPCAGGMSLGDTDNDGIYELYMNERDMYFGDGAWGRGTISYWADNLTVRWQLYGWGASSNIPMLADVNKDGIVDVVTTDLSAGVCVLNSTNGRPLTNADGKVLSETRIGGRHNHYQSSIYDFDGDGNLEVLSGDGFEGQFDYISIFDLYDWTLDGSIDTTIVGPVLTRSWKGPTVGEVSGDGIMDLLVVTFDPNAQNNGQLQVYDRNYNLIYLNTGLRHRAIDAVVQDIDEDGLNEVLVLTQGGVIYCFESNGIPSNPRARSEVQFYSESRNGASTYVPFERPFADVSLPSPVNGELGVSVGLTSLRFTLNHPDSELMDYVVTSSPNIASASVNNVGDGQKTVAVTGSLASNSLYHWQVVVTDQSDHVTTQYYSFTTGPYVANRAPTQSQPSLVGSTTKADLVATPVNTQDADGNDVTNIYNWQKNGVSIANINLPFETQTDHQDEYSALAATRDYAFGSTGIVGGATWVPDGVVGGAYLFDGTDFILFPETGTSNRYDGGGNWDSISLECWVKGTTTTSTERLIWKPDQYDGDFSYRLDYRNRGSSIEYTWYVSTTDGNWSIPVYSLTSNLANWHQIACTYKSGIGLRLYIDGVEVASNLSPAITGNILSTSGPFTIAFRSGSDFAGYLDEVKLFPTEISSSMISQSYLDATDGASSSSTISKYDTTVGDQWRCQVTPNDGFTDGSTATTVTRTIIDTTNILPTASNLMIIPASPIAADSLEANYDYFDANGDPEVGSVISWYKNGGFNVSTALISEGYSALPAGYAAKGEVWYFRVTPSDGFDFGVQTAPSSSVTIQNTPPAFTSVIIAPDPAFEGNTLTANSFGWNDADNDIEGYTYQWQKLNGVAWDNIIGATTKTLAPVNFVAGDTVKAVVTAYDGTAAGNTIEAETQIIDSAQPTTGTPILSGIRDDDELTCTAFNTQNPEGGEIVTNIFNWLRGGTSTTGLYLPFNINSITAAKDYSGHSNNGAVTGATWTSEGAIGGGYSLDGDALITVADSASLGNDGSWSQLTLEYWINPSENQRGSQIISKNGGDGNNGVYLTGFQSSSRSPYNTVYFGAIVGGGYEEAAYQETSSAPETVIPFGSWTHIVGTYKSGDGFKLYINGTLASSLDGIGGNIEANIGGPLLIGNSFSGLLDEVRIYPTALSAAQVFQNFVDQRDGVSDSVTIVPQETSSGQTWLCSVTPNDGWQDGTPQSSSVTVTSPNTVPHIDYYAPVDSETSVYLGQSLDFNVVASDPNGSPLTFTWTLDSVTQNNAVTNPLDSTWTYSPLSASVHIVKVAVYDGTTTINHQWTINVETPTTLTVNTVGSGIVTLDPSGGYYPDGTEVTLTAVPVLGSTFLGWSDDASGTELTTTVTMDADKTVTATFTSEGYSLTVNVVGSGSVAKSPDQTYFADGAEVDLTATADPGWTFTGWSGDLTGYTNPATLSMDADKTVTATFTQNQYTLIVNVDSGGSVMRNPDEATYVYGDIVELTAVPQDGFIFESWGGDASGTDLTTTITIDDNKAVTAIFEVEPDFLFGIEGYESGDFTAWTGTTVATGTATVTSSNPHSGTYSGQFATSAGTAGTVRRAYSYVNLDNLNEVYAWAYVYLPNDLTIPNGQKLFPIQFNDAAGNALASYGIIADATGMRWAVQYATWPNSLGTSVPSGEGWYILEAYFTHAASGPTLILSVNDVEVASLIQDTSTSNAVAAARFGQVYYTGANALTINVDDVAISTEPEEPTYTLTINIAPSASAGSVTPDAAGPYHLGDVITLTSTANTGYIFSEWSGDGVAGAENTRVVTITGNMDVTAIFNEVITSSECIPCSSRI